MRKNKPSSPKLGEFLFSIAIITDTHVNPDENECNSPFPVNRLANARLRYVVNELNRQDIDFVAHLGDLIHPVPSVLERYNKAANAFHDLIKPLKHPIYFTPGNHDVGDKPINWGPTNSVTSQYLEAWKAQFKSHYQCFHHRGFQFFIINNEIINSGILEEFDQKKWLEEKLEQSKDKRIIFFTHYPLYLSTEHEDEHYDNMAEPGRSWLLGLMKQYNVEAIFAGHVHNFWYHRHHQSDYYILPATSFVRQDFSEMYRIEPGAEAGRNDAEKLGYAIVNFYEQGHCVNIIRTHGNQLSPNQQINDSITMINPSHPNERKENTLGVDLRQSWCEYTEIPPSGALDEFDRKTVRNDYPVMALWEMGIKKLRIPFTDLVNKNNRRRIHDLLFQGHDFTLFSYGTPTRKQIELLMEHNRLINNWEIGFIEKDLPQLSDVFCSQMNVQLFLSPIKQSQQHTDDTQTYYHTIEHGFSVTDEKFIERIYHAFNEKSVNPGLVFRLRFDDQLENYIEKISAISNTFKCAVSVHFITSDRNPSIKLNNEEQFIININKAYNLSIEKSEIQFFIDIFADVDRGYFVRNGLVNRRYNPNKAGMVLRNFANSCPLI